jgi:hypothetical protein
MDTPSALFLIACSLFLIALLWRLQTPGRRLQVSAVPYTRRSSLLTAGELRFYRVRSWASFRPGW